MCFREWRVGLQLAELPLKIENANMHSFQPDYGIQITLLYALNSALGALQSSQQPYRVKIATHNIAVLSVQLYKSSPA